MNELRLLAMLHLSVRTCSSADAYQDCCIKTLIWVRADSCQTCNLARLAKLAIANERLPLLTAAADHRQDSSASERNHGDRYLLSDCGSWQKATVGLLGAFSKE